MNISYNWLRDLIELDISPADTAKALTSVGLAVEGIAPAEGDDSVFDIDLTSNRPDCLSHRGVARELGAILDRGLKTSSKSEEWNVSGTPLARIEDPSGCLRFTARRITGVKVGPSPAWLVERLEAIGERSINNVADITNYVMHELGQPMHAFDASRVEGGFLTARRAAPGEKITTLDGVVRDLDPSILCICDNRGPVAVAGIMGGEASSITEATTDVILEVAYFDRGTIRNGSRQLGLATEASYRFERGVDITALRSASDRAVELITQLAGGVVGECSDIYPATVQQGTVVAKDLASSLRRLTGQVADIAECHRILVRLGINCEAADQGYTYLIPGWRHDLRIEEDLVEEVARHLGYSTITEELAIGRQAGEYQATELKERRLRSALRDSGFAEAITYSFIDQKHDGVFDLVPGVTELSDAAGRDGLVTLCDSVIEGAVRMRPTLLPGLLDSVRFNLNHQQRDLRFFEMGRVFAAGVDESGLPNEQRSIGLAITGSVVSENRLARDRQLDFFDIKGTVEMLCSSLAIEPTFAASDVRHLRKGQAAEILVNGECIGYCGRLSDRIAGSYKFRQPVFIAELNLGRLLQIEGKPVIYAPISRFPGIVRDVSLILRGGLTFAEVKGAITGQGAEILREVGFVELYEFDVDGEHRRSLTIRLTYRSDERTLVDGDVEQLHEGLILGACRALGIEPPAFG